MTVESYFEILEDTYVGFRIPAFHDSPRKQNRKAPKFYLIDPGFKRSLERTTSVPLLPQTSAFGNAFEHWVVLEFIKLAKYLVLDWEFFYLLTKDGQEIDLIVTRPGRPILLVEIKSKEKVSDLDAKILENLGNEFSSPTEKWLLSRDPLPQKFGSTKAFFWKDALEKLL